MRWAPLLSLVVLAEAAPKKGMGMGMGMGMYSLAKRQGGTTMLRFGCPQVVIDRLDPLVNPGQVPAAHMHQIVGGNAFNASMTTGDVSTKATCTTCQFSEDFSNYWTANLYFKSPKNGSFKRVKQFGAALQFGDQFSTKIDGGILVYYVSAQPGKITAFKPGFRMLVGDPMERSRSGTRLKNQNCYRCYSGPNFGGDVSAPCADARLDTEALPKGKCAGGIRSNIHFPTCWDGRNLDAPNHKDHVAYPTTGPATFLQLGGACPSTHPVRIPQLMYEVTWQTQDFANDWPTTGQPFYLSTGDNTGLGQHGDYVFGWQGNSLQKAMDTANCFGARCGTLKTQSIEAAKACQVKAQVNEERDGWFSKLPGIEMTD